jgi:hypothetical protein
LEPNVPPAAPFMVSPSRPGVASVFDSLISGILARRAVALLEELQAVR